MENVQQTSLIKLQILSLEKDKVDTFVQYPLEQQQRLYAALVADMQELQNLCIDLGKVVANTPHNRSQ